LGYDPAAMHISEVDETISKHFKLGSGGLPRAFKLFRNGSSVQSVEVRMDDDQ
jgi:hypothetical protein